MQFILFVMVYDFKLFFFFFNSITFSDTKLPLTHSSSPSYLADSQESSLSPRHTSSHIQVTTFC